MTIKNTDCARRFIDTLSAQVERGDLDDILARIDKKRDQLPLREAVEQALREAADEIELKAARKQLAHLQNSEALTSIVHSVFKAIESRPDATIEDAFKALISGTVSGAYGSRDSAQALKEAVKKSSLSKVRARLKIRGLDKAAVSGAFDEDIAIALYLKTAAPEDAARYNGRAIDPKAQEIADILYEGKQQLIADMRAIGVQLDERPGHILPQAHNRSRIARAAQGLNPIGNGKTAADKARWIGDIAPLIDFERTLANIQRLRDHPDAKGLIPDNIASLDRQKFLETLYEILTTTRTREGAPRPGDHGEEFLKARIIEFTSPEAFVTYNKAFGNQSLMAAFDAFAEHAAHTIATIKFFGPGGRATLAKAVRAVEEIFLDKKLQTNTSTKTEFVEKIPEYVGPLYKEPAKDWPENFPKIKTLTNIKKIKSHPKYAEAKKGDKAAAYQVVLDTVKKEKLLDIANKYPDAIIVPVHAKEAAGKNKLPAALATYFSENTGLTLNEDIVQINKVGRTNTNYWHRMAFRPSFEGKVDKGKNYILVDDVVTGGGTLSELRQYIESNGGNVVHIVTLGAAQFSTNIKLSKETLNKLNAKFGLENLKKFLYEENIYGGNPGALTEAEARGLLRLRSLNEARNRIAKARSKRNRQLHAQSSQERTPGIDTPPLEKFTPDQINKHLDSLARVNSGITSLDRLWDDFSGAATHPASFTVETINRGLGAWQRMRLLGGAIFANLSDAGIQQPLQLWLQNGLPLWRAFLNPLIAPFKIAGNKELQNFLNELGIGIESQFAQLYSQRITGSLVQPGDLIGRAEGAFFKSTLLPQFTDLNSRSYAATLGHKMARDAHLHYDELSPKARRHLQYYGITAKDWDIIRQHATGDFNGYAIMIPDKLRHVPDDLIRRTYPDATTPDAIQAKKLDLAHALHTLYLDATDFASLQQDAYTRALSNPGNFQQGTIARTLWDQFFMFKGFAVAFTTKVLGRNIRTSRPHEIALMFGALALGGTIVHTLNLLRKGRVPDIENMTPADAAQYILQGFLYAGGAGLFGDLLFSAGVKETLSGRGEATMSFGPTADWAAQGASLFTRALQGKDVAAQTARWLNSSLPYSNHWLLKPFLDYSLTFGLQEYLSPGTLRKLEQRAADDKTPFWLPPSEFAQRWD